MEVQRPIINDSEMLTVFPEAKSLVEKYVSKYKKELNAIYREQKKVRQDTFRKVKDLTRLELIQELYVILKTDTARQLELEAKLEKYGRMLKRVKNNNSGSNSIETAKQIPISDYIEFNRSGFACCIWHSEKTPSMKYYERNNRVHCFGCGKSGDVIDVVAQLNNCSISEALKIIGR